MNRKVTLLASAMAAAVLAGSALAKVPDEVAARLGQDLNPMGGEIAGNAAGTIPAWDGGLTSPPAGITYDPATMQPPDPFPGDQPLFRITAANMSQYADNLTEGAKALLQNRDSYFMDVYTSRRTCSNPQFVYDASRRNASAGDLIRGGDGSLDGAGVLGAIMGAPFPIPNNGLEAIWNHTLRFRGFKLTRQFAAFPVQRDGSSTPIIVQDEAILRWSDPGKTRAEDLNNVSLLYIANTIAPARLAGNVILVHESLNATVAPRQAWQYNPGTRRVRRAPDISYDNPGTNTDGMSTSDAFDGYNGAPDRYDWQLVGKFERYVPYNSYRLLNSKYADLIRPLNINQELARYELHRVWTVEAKLRPGTRHVYSRRVFHIDEDSTTIVGSEMYDGRGELWRVQELHSVNFYHVPTCGGVAELMYDLQDGRYLASTLRGEEPPVNYFADELNEDRYTPQAIRGMGKR